MTKAKAQSTRYRDRAISRSPLRYILKLIGYILTSTKPTIIPGFTKMTKFNRSVSEYFEAPEVAGLSGLLQHVNYLQTLTPMLMNALPDVIAQHCQLANYRQGRLIISVSNQAIATRLRFILPDLRQQLRKHPAFAGLIGIDFYMTKPLPNHPIAEPRQQRYRKQIASKQMSLSSDCAIPDKALQVLWQQLLQHINES